MERKKIIGITGRRKPKLGVKQCVCDACGNVRVIKKEYWQTEGLEEFLYDFCKPCWEAIEIWTEIQERKK